MSKKDHLTSCSRPKIKKALLLLLLLFIGEIFYMGYSREQLNREYGVIQEINSMKVLYQKIEALFEVRVHHQSFDDIVQDIKSFEKSFDILSTNELFTEDDAWNQEISRHLMMLKEKFLRSKEHVERYKSHNSITINSTRYLFDMQKHLKENIAHSHIVKDKEKAVRLIDDITVLVALISYDETSSFNRFQKKMERLKQRVNDDDALRKSVNIFEKHITIVIEGHTVMHALKIENDTLKIKTTLHDIYTLLLKHFEYQDNTNQWNIYLLNALVFLLLLFLYMTNKKESRLHYKVCLLNSKLQDNVIELESTNKQLSKLVKHFDINVIASETDARGVITYVSEAFCAISGYRKDEILGKPHNIVRHSDMPDEIFKELWQTIKAGKVWKGEIKNLKKDGGFYWVDVSITPEFSADGTISGYGAIRHDITSKKELEALSKTLESRIREEVEKNRKQTAHMVQQSRLAQMGEMISMIAHQWRQPLASISAISGTLTLDIIMDTYKKEFFQERLEAITDLSSHLSSTIDDFRDFFKVNKEKEYTRWEEITTGSLQIIGPTLRTKEITIHESFECDETIHTYPNELKQVILNLLKNAEDILLEKKVADPQIWMRSYTKEQHTYLSIEDNAGGIPEDIIERVFDPYFSTKTKKDGTGLGLYMSKTIIEEHCKGSLCVTNGVHGALFEITLPLREAS